MYLADTSAWLNALRTRPVGSGIRLNELIVSGSSVFLTGIIVQEVLQGARDELHFQRMRDWLTPQRLVSPHDEVDTYIAAARLYAKCRWRGVTPRSSNDCLIAQIAIEHNLTVLHDDSDYEKMAKVEPRLKLA